MAARFVSASSQGLLRSTAPVTAAPFTIGLWVTMPTSGATEGLWSLTEVDDTVNHWVLYKNGSNAICVYINSASAGAFPDGATAIGNNQPTFVIFREISNASHRLSILHSSGAREHVANTTAVTPAGVTAVSLGYRGYLAPDIYMDGRLSEYWMTNSDIQPGGAQLDNALLIQLARFGPMSVPHVRDRLIEYMPLRDSLLGDKGDYYSSRGRGAWSNVNGVTLAT